MARPRCILYDLRSTQEDRCPRLPPPPAADAARADPDELELTDEDILDALAQIPGYIDISTEDFRTVYHLAWRHAVARLRAERERSDDGAA